MLGDNDNTNNEAEAVMTATSVILPGTDMEMSAPYGLAVQTGISIAIASRIHIIRFIISVSRIITSQGPR